MVVVVVAAAVVVYGASFCLQCFDAVGWVAGKASCKKTAWWGAGIVICLRQGANLYMAEQLTISCSRMVPKRFTFLVPAHPGSPGQRAIK